MTAGTQTDERTFARVVDSQARLREIIVAPKPDAPAILKQQDRLDAHCRAVIAQAPFLLLATADAAGRCDVSPRGDAPGFVGVLDDRTIVIPDRPGNRRLDSLQNIIENPQAGVIFLVPGMEETLRVQGRAAIVEDEDVLAPLAVGGKPPRLGIVVRTDEVYFQCAKALRRSRLWQPESWSPRDTLPTFGRILRDQIATLGMTADEADAYLEESNKRLY